MSHVYAPRDPAMRIGRKPKPPQAYAAPLEERISARVNERIERIRLLYQGLAAEGKSTCLACRIIAERLQTSVSSVQSIVKRLKREGRIEKPQRIAESENLTPEIEAHIIRRRNELASEGKSEYETSTIIAGELSASQNSVWNKIQQLIKKGKIPPKRELSRQRRRSNSFQLAEHEKREKLRKERAIKKKEEKPPCPVERHDAEIEELLEKSRRAREGIFVPINPQFVPEGRVPTVMGFAQSRIGGLPRFRREKQGEETKCFFSLARAIAIEAQVSGGTIFVRKSSIPAVLFAAAIENGPYYEAMGEIGALRREISENRNLFPRRVPSWLGLKIWAARALCSENVDGGANSERIQRMEEEIPFSRLAAFFGHTQKIYPELHQEEAELEVSALFMTWRTHSSLASR